MSTASNPLALEYIRAIAQMTPRERGLMNAILSSNDSLFAVEVLLELLANDENPMSAGDVALIAQEAISMLRQAGTAAHSAQALAIGDALGATLH